MSDCGILLSRVKMSNFMTTTKMYFCMIDRSSAVRTLYTPYCTRLQYIFSFLVRTLFCSWKKDTGNLVMTARIPKDDVSQKKMPESITCIASNITVKNSNTTLYTGYSSCELVFCNSSLT